MLSNIATVIIIYDKTPYSSGRPMSKTLSSCDYAPFLKFLQSLRFECDKIRTVPSCYECQRTAFLKQRTCATKIERERIEKLLDPGSFVEIDEFVVHRETASIILNLVVMTCFLLLFPFRPPLGLF